MTRICSTSIRRRPSRICLILICGRICLSRNYSNRGHPASPTIQDYSTRRKPDEHQQVAAKAAALAEAAQIPLGSLHSVLQSLEKKQLIKTARAGSAQAPAVYQVL